MNHLFVPYEFALMAKEHYFDEPCLAFYNLFIEDSPTIPNIQFQESVKITECYWIKNSGSNTCAPDEYVAAPTYQQLHDWFDKCGIVISIEYAASDTNKFHYRIDNYHAVYRIVGTDIMAGSYGNYSKEWYKTRKKCTDAAFTEAFKILNKK